MTLKPTLEAILFAHGEPLSAEKLAKAAKAKKDEVLTALKELSQEYQGRGLTILEKGDEFTLGSNPAYAGYVENLIKEDLSEELSRAAVETIAIVAYKGPLTRAQIEYVRGVNSSFTLRNLLMRGLVERMENPKDARSYLYKVSFDFLKHLGISRLEDLPQYEEFKKEKIEVLEEPQKQN